MKLVILWTVTNMFMVVLIAVAMLYDYDVKRDNTLNTYDQVHIDITKGRK